jgi:2-polyprenyl-3-methyl-5-hydroxy-6-metoxy-1,4-benzoquinol methylase
MQSYGWSSAVPTCSVPYLLPVVVSHLGRPPACVLDVGCGNGYISGRVQQAGFDVTGIDVDAEGVAIAKEAWPEVRFEISDVASFEVDAVFDFVISTEVVEHLYDPRAFAAGCHRALRLGGKLILSTPYHGYAKNLLLSLTNSWDRHFDALRAGGHIKFWSRRTLRRLLTEAGFRDVHFQGAGRIPYVWMSDVAIAVK